jgi:hypothetical protein
MPTASPLFAPTFTQNEGTCDGDGYTLNPSQATFLAQNDREADKRIVFSYELHLSENATEALIIIESVERRILQAVLGGYCITGDMRRLQVAPVFDSNPPDFPVGKSELTRLCKTLPIHSRLPFSFVSIRLLWRQMYLGIRLDDGNWGRSRPLLQGETNYL